MIQAVGEETRFEEEITALAAGDTFACRIISLYRCYPPRLVFVDYWLIRDDESGKTTGAAARNGSNFILFLTESADLDEVSSFMRIAGASGIICSGAYKLDLSRESHTGPVLVRNERIEVPDEGARFLLPDIKTAYELIAGCADENFRPPVFEDFYVDVNHKLRHQAISLLGAEEDGRLVALAMTVAESDDGAVLGAVACLPGYRKRGFGSRVVSALTNRLIGENKRVFLHRANNANVSFYERLGFSECGTWREYN